LTFKVLRTLHADVFAGTHEHYNGKKSTRRLEKARIRLSILRAISIDRQLRWMFNYKLEQQTKK
jgi:hypothetical protein